MPSTETPVGYWRLSVGRTRFRHPDRLRSDSAWAALGDHPARLTCTHGGQSVTLLVRPVVEVSWELDGQRNTYARFTMQALKYDPAGAF